MRAVSVSLLLLATVLAGCADEGTPSESDEDLFEDKNPEATATTGVIRGVVVDVSITPVADVTVVLKGQDMETTTDEQGLFAFADLEPGTYFLETKKVAYSSVQQSVDVVAGVDRPPIVKIQIEALPDARPFIEPLFMTGYLTCGAAIFATSVGCTTLPAVASAIGDQSIFPVDYERIPNWVQGELVWDATQPLAGAFIWEITPQGSNTHFGYRETTTSPALNYLDNATLEARGEDLIDPGINFRFFGGPHPLCTGIYGFGCGVTLEQEVEVFVHNFYNFVPQEGWRFTSDGEHPVPR